jgi:2-iminobutanoate/2-iminopropanoate deaminase
MRLGFFIPMLLLAAPLAAQNRVIVRLPGSDTTLPFVPAVRSGNLVFAAGQLGVMPGTRNLVAGGIRAETRQALENLDAAFRAAGTSLSRAVKCTVFMADIGEWAAMNEVYVTFFPSGLPARSTIGASGLVLGGRVEIECIAAMP